MNNLKLSAEKIRNLSTDDLDPNKVVSSVGKNEIRREIAKDLRLASQVPDYILAWARII